MAIGLMPSLPASVRAEAAGDSVVLNVMDYGADPTGAVDSAEAIQAALEAAMEYEAAGKAVTLRFPRGEYHIYKDHALTREYHTSNTNSIENPIKTIGLLIEEHKNLTIDGCGSLFMMHGNMMALAVVKSENITLKDFAWDFAVPTVTELTVTASGANYTEFYIPECFPYQISGNTLVWSSDLSPYTGKPDSNAEVSFTDVKTGEFYTTAVAWAVENNITNGMGDGTFGVNGTCNRAQVVTFLYRALNK